MGNCMEVIQKSWPTFTFINYILKPCMEINSCFFFFLWGMTLLGEYVYINFLHCTTFLETHL